MGDKRMSNGSSFRGFYGSPEQAIAQLTRERDSLLLERDGLVGKLKELEQAPQGIFTVIACPRPGRVVVGGNPPVDLRAPEGAKRGSQVRSVGGSNQPLEVLPEPVAFGTIVTVLSVEGSHAVIEDATQKKLLPYADGLKLSGGDRVALDPFGAIILKVLPGSAGQSFQLETPQTIAWDDIGGQEEAKEALREAIEYPVRFADVYKAHGQKPARGALLYGPPGCGKTMLARALATSVAGDTGGFLYVKGAEVLSKFVGDSERNIRGLFQQAREYKTRTGKPAVIFFDEADAVLSERRASGVAFAGVERTLVATFLAEMDGLDDAAAFVLLASNKPDHLDAAVVREGRCDHKVRVSRPDKASAEAIFRLALRGRHASDPAALAGAATEQLFGERLMLLELTYPGVRTSEYLRLRDLVSGAMIEGIVQKAAAAAIRRDRESGQVSELSAADVEGAIKLTLRQQARVNHNDVIAELSASFGKMPEKVRKVIDG